MIKAFIFLFILLPIQVFAHKGEDHSKKKVVSHVSIGDPFYEIYKNINAEYSIKIKPIFQGKCFDCHSSQTKFPWYYKVPGIKQIINSHVKEANSHLDMTNGFPFKGHASPEKDLKEIKKVILNNSMPPWYYKPFHANSELAPEEKNEILNWINLSLTKIGEIK